MEPVDYVEPPDLEEVMDTVQKKKNNKAPGVNNLPPDYLNAMGKNFLKLATTYPSV